MKLWAFLFLAALAFTSTAAAQPTGNPAAISVGKQAIAVATASSHCPIDPISALNDGREPGSSQDRGIPHLSFYARVGTFEWLQYDFPAAQTFEGCEVYWSDDQDIPKKSPRDRGLGLPEFWKVLYLSETGEWLPVAGQPPCTQRRTGTAPAGG